MNNDYLTVNYPFEKIIDKTKSDYDFHIETPWIDDDEFWNEAEVEVLVNDENPFLRVIKLITKTVLKR